MYVAIERIAIDGVEGMVVTGRLNVVPVLYVVGNGGAIEILGGT